MAPETPLPRGRKFHRATSRGGDRETRRHGEGENTLLVPTLCVGTRAQLMHSYRDARSPLLVSVSPCLRVSLSPCLLVSVSPPFLIPYLLAEYLVGCLRVRHPRERIVRKTRGLQDPPFLASALIRGAEGNRCHSTQDRPAQHAEALGRRAELAAEIVQLVHELLHGLVHDLGIDRQLIQ